VSGLAEAHAGHRGGPLQASGKGRPEFALPLRPAV